MNARILFLAICLILLLGSASAVYELCDSVERVSDANNVTFTCNITSSKISFTQQDIDGFWEKILADGDYTHGRLETVEWKIKSSVIQVADDLRFVEPLGMDITWDIVLEGDTNTTHDLNQATATPLRPANQTAIKQRIGGLQNYFISIAPLGGRKSVRNLTLEKPEGALAVYILGSTIKKMDIDIEGTLSISGGHIENVDSLKAKNIALSNIAYLQNIGSIEAENISIESSSYIRGVGSFDETAIKIKNGETGLIVKGNSYIENLKGYIKSDSDIYLEEESGIKNLSYTPSETIQLIQADNLTLKNESYIMGLGGKPGQIMLNGTLNIENSKIIGRGNNKPLGVKVNAILMSDNSVLQGFTGDIEVEGKETFVLESGSVIGEVLGIINSCTKLSMDGNETKIRFLENSPKEIKAKGIDLNNGAKIECIGETDCNYFYIYQSCDAEPRANLEMEEARSGNVPFAVEFTGGCDAEGAPVTCTINFGDGSSPELFDSNISHTYLTTGSFKAVLTAQTSEMSSTSEKTIVAVEAGATPPVIEEVQASLSVQSVAKGGEISIILQCEDQIELFSIENTLGIAPVTTAPEQCPAILGPFKIPESTAAGNYIFTVSGTTENGTEFEQILSISVETSPLIPWLPFDLDDFTIFAIAGFIGLVAVIVVLVVLVKKKKGFDKKKKETGKKKGETRKEKEELDEKIMKRAAKELAQGQVQMQPGEKMPPWMVKETENGLRYKVEKPAPEAKQEPKLQAGAKPEKEKPAEKKSIEPAKTAEKKPTEPTKPTEKKAGFLGFLKKKKKPLVAKEPERIQTAKKPEGIQVAKKLEGIKEPTKMQVPAEAKAMMAKTEEKKPAIKNIVEKKPTEPTKPIEKKPAIKKTMLGLGIIMPGHGVPKTAQAEPKAIAKRFENLVELVKGTEGKVIEKPVEIKKPLPVKVKKPAVKSKPAEFVSEKQALKPSRPKPEEKHYAAEEKQAVEEKKEAGKQEPGDSGWFKRKKNPAAKEEEKTKELPKWLKKN